MYMYMDLDSIWYSFRYMCVELIVLSVVCIVKMFFIVLIKDLLVKILGFFFVFK